MHRRLSNTELKTVLKAVLTGETVDPGDLRSIIHDLEQCRQVLADVASQCEWPVLLPRYYDEVATCAYCETPEMLDQYFHYPLFEHRDTCPLGQAWGIAQEVASA